MVFERARRAHRPRRYAVAASVLAGLLATGSPAIAGGLSVPASGTTATATDDWPRPSSVWNSVVPQTGQKRNLKLAPWSPARTYSVAVPMTV